MIIETKLVPKMKLFPRGTADGDFKIYACSCNDKDVERNSHGDVSIKGLMPRLDLGTEYSASIEVADRHPKHGVSYNAIAIYQDVGDNRDAQHGFFLTMLTELQMQEVYKAYPNDDIVELFKNNTFDYNKVKGFGPVTYDRVRKRVIEALDYMEMLSKLGKYGITYDTIIKLAEEFGSKELAIQKIEENPFELTRVSGFGFKRVDPIAQRMGFGVDHPFRIQFGIKYTLEENQNDGHTFMFKRDLLLAATDILGLDEDKIQEQIEQTDGIKVLDDKITLTKTYNAESYIANTLKEMMSDNTELEFDPDEFIGRMETKHQIKLSDEQRGFFFNLKKGRVNLLIGWAGTGKSMLQKLLVDLLEELNLSYIALSPTGKAAKILSAYMNRPTQTIHKAIGFGMNKERQQLVSLPHDFILVDEFGMSDVFVTSGMLSKITNKNARILFIGDPAQIPSVSAGNVLHNMLESGVVPSTKLTVVFRQSEGGILDIATKVRQGESIIPYNFSGKKVFGNNLILHCVNPTEMEKGYRHYYDYFLKTYAPEDILVLSPKKMGNLGTVAINKYIQSEVNPPIGGKKEHPYGEVCVFRVGDYVINTRNTYDKLNLDGDKTDIVNGDTGIITDIIIENENNKSKSDDEDDEPQDQRGIIVDYDADTVRMTLGEANQLLHSWCLTYHKSQGGSAKAVLVIADKSNAYQLNSNLLYVALTRAVEKCVVLTQADTLNNALKKFENMKRLTWLEWMLKTNGEDEAV